jgi:Uma2 family endonuclease
MVTEQHLYTGNQFEEIIRRPESRDRTFELIDGAIVEKVPTQQHGLIAARFIIRIGLFLEQGHRGRIAPEVRHQVPGDERNVRQPDISFYLDTTAPVITRGPVPGMPDLAIEIKSPDDTNKSMRERAAYYLAHGSSVVWLVFPEKRLLEVHTPEDFETLTESDILDGGDLLPGFQVSVRDIFAL